MENKSYYTDDIKNGNQCLTDRPLHVNCTGVCSFQFDFYGGNKNGRNDYYLMYLCRGELSVNTGGKRLTMKSGELIIYPPKMPYEYTNTADTHVDYFWLHFTGADVKKLLCSVGLPLGIPVGVSVDERIIGAFQQLFDEYIYRDAFFEPASVSRLINICTLFGRSVAGLSSVQNSSGSLNRSLRYIDEHYTSPITTKELADLEHMSCGHFRVRFKAKTGMTPTCYITTLRLRNACNLLKQTDLTVKEISQSVGFSDQMYFTRVFTGHFGVPPKVFRL